MAQIPTTGTTSAATARAAPRVSDGVTLMVPAGMSAARWTLSIGFTFKL